MEEPYELRHANEPSDVRPKPAPQVYEQEHPADPPAAAGDEVVQSAGVASPAVASVPLSRGLSGKLLLFTAVFVLLAEILIFPPSAAHFRANWLGDKLGSAAAAGRVLIETADGPVDGSSRDRILNDTGVRFIAVHDNEMSRVVAGPDDALSVDASIAMSEARRPIASIPATFRTLFSDGERILRVYGEVADSPGKIYEIVLAEAPLHSGLVAYSRNVALLSLLVSAITASLVFFVIMRLFIAPIRRMTRSMLIYSQDPSDRSRILKPSGRGDEIGVAEDQLAAMQFQLTDALDQQRRLADLGLAVSKINHDMRNILSVAQILTERLERSSDPMVQRFGPRLVQTMDRAIAYANNVLEYGKSRERPPDRRRLKLGTLIEEVRQLAEIEAEAVEFRNEVEPDFEVDADAEQLFRVINNLCRNAIEAMVNESDRPGLIRRLTVSARRQGAVAFIRISDTGPGLPQKALENLFTAFRGSARSGGTGLGLAIAHELVRAHGGQLELMESRGGHTCFCIELPDAPIRFRARKDTLI
ncbi:sensor histidine kinase [Notoacmeibacter ruber]|uniref:histidine kinase n=1 Tax=Notoacmeibacter ruber TaxID=2670375 RepID=A0A3L7J8L1_9HYPH|nr:HAMP domain-containing sensor histidine kinase [Notoacmeibacter ruber]RLQ87077.1 sensor histidine kinase [Notoacmeibacter ruber]